MIFMASLDKIPRHRLMAWVGITFFVVCLCLTAGCTGDEETNASPSPAPVDAGAVPAVERVEIYHFFASRQCASCVAVGALAEETVETYYAPQLESGILVFDSVSIEAPDNREIVERYSPTGSSLWIGVYDGEGFHKEENLVVWYKITNKEEYMQYLKSVIDKRLAGDFS